MNRPSFHLLIAAFLLSPALAFAGAAVTYHGRILGPNGEAVEAPGVTFKIQVRSPGTTNCLLYEETRTIDLRNSEGIFVIPIGDGTTGQRTANDPGITIEDVFSNSPVNRTGLSCNSGHAYQPTALDSRKLLVTFNDGTGSGDQALPAMDINYVPFSLHAEEATRALSVGSVAASQIMSVASGTVTPLTAANFAELLLLVNGNSAAYVKPSSVPTCASGEVLKGTGGAFVCVTDSSGSDTLAGISCADGKILKRSAGAWACADESGVGTESDPTVQAYAKVAPGTGLTVSAGALVPDFGATAGKVAQGNDSRFTDARAPNGAATGDLAGSYPNPTVKGLRGNSIATTTPLNGQVYQWVLGSTEWQPKFLSFADLKKSDGTAQMPASCAANQTLAWSAITDVFSCADIGSLDASKMTTGTLSAARLPTDTMILTCADGKIAKRVAGAWACADDGASDLNGVVSTGILQRTGAGSFSTLGVAAPITNSAGNIGVAVGAGLTLSSGSLVPDFGTAGGKVAQGNDSRFPSSACASGNYNRWNGSAWVCDTDAATDSTKVLKSGDTMTGTLNLPANGLVIGTTQLAMSGGNVGIGTASPAVALDLGSKTDALALPKGSSAQQPGSPVAGWLRYNTTNSSVEVYNGTAWTSIGQTGTAVSPAGMVSAFPMSACPSGWLEANGSAVSRATYTSLFTAIGTTYGAGDGSTTFNIPDYRGYFLRGWDHGAANDPDRASRTNRGDGTTGDSVGTKQADAFQAHQHTGDFASKSGQASPDGSNLGPSAIYMKSATQSGYAADGANGTPRTSSETRSKNINVTYCVNTATVSLTTVSSSGSGTANYVPLWSSTTALGSSPIAVTGGNVGIGTTAPAEKLEVAGNIKISGGGNGLKFADGTTQTTAAGGGIAAKTTAQRNAMSPVEGTIIYNSTTKRLEFYNGTEWMAQGTPISVNAFTSSDSLASGLTRYWSMNSTGTTQSDPIGANTLTYSNTPTTDSGFGSVSGGARCFNGTSQYGSFANPMSAAYGPTDPVTISFWYKGTETSASWTNSPVFGWNSGAIYSQFEIVNGKFMFVHVSGGWQTNKVSTTSVNTNNWYHIVYVRRADQTIDIYVNGTAELNNVSAPIDNGNGYYVNTLMYGYSGAYTQGCIDELGVWNRALNSSEVNSLYNSGTGYVYR